MQIHVYHNIAGIAFSRTFCFPCKIESHLELVLTWYLCYCEYTQSVCRLMIVVRVAPRLFCGQTTFTAVRQEINISEGRDSSFVSIHKIAVKYRLMYTKWTLHRLNSTETVLNEHKLVCITQSNKSHINQH